MNIAEILKDCPKRTKLYSPVYGEVKFLYISNDSNYPIITEIDNGCSISFTSDGRLYNSNHNGECMLFPYKDNRAWSTFKVPNQKYEFKPFDKVLVRDTNNDIWQIDFFGYIDASSDCKYNTMTSNYKKCIPYEGNEHLLGTKNNPT